MQGRRAERVEDDVATRSGTQSAVPPTLVAAGRLRLSVREPAHAEAAAEVPPSARIRAPRGPSLSSPAAPCSPGPPAGGDARSGLAQEGSRRIAWPSSHRRAVLELRSHP